MRRPPARVFLLLLLALAAGCARREPPAATPPSAVLPPAEAPVETRDQPAAVPRGGELPEALGALEDGRLEEAERRLAGVVANGTASEERGSATYLLALLLARPDYSRRDVARARLLLEGFLASRPPAAQETGARLVLSLLEQEEDYLRLVADLRMQAASAGAEADDLRGVLSQREAELRRIKEILLGRTGGS